jgi:hypothetical protein
MLIDDLYFSLEFARGGCSLESNDPLDYVYSTHGKIVATDESDKVTDAGRFHLYYLDVGAALNAGGSIFDLFDSRSSTVDYFEAIFDPRTLDISDKLQKLLDGSGWGNVLILNRLELLPGFRQKNLGLLVMRRLIERFGAGAYVVAIKPFPLQCESARDDEDDWGSKLQLAHLSKNLERATKKLRDHYSKLGFKAMRGTPFMFLLADTPLPPPRSFVE